MTNIQNPYAREHLSLNGDWHYIVDPYEIGFLDMFGDENTQVPELHWYEGAL
ncbi:MAG: hypothetical protein ACI9HA_002257 [Dinoroseobacter sp.]|jgi:hypothetical protein